MKVFNIFFIVVFILFAALQYNDPDPYVWIPIYLYAAFICYLAIKGIYNRLLYIIGFVVYALYAAFLFFDPDGVLSWIKNHGSENIAETMQALKPWIEETREFFGLVILIVVLLINFLAKNNRVNSLSKI